MLIIGVCGSPRKGNTEWMLIKLLEGAADAGAETELILLRQKTIERCDGCLACEAGGENRKGVCKIEDDMQEIYPRLLQADGLAFGTPVYFELLSGLLKDFMDRTCPIWPLLKAKPIAGTAVAEAGIGKAVQNLETYASLCDMHWVGHVTTLAKNPGQAAKDKELELELKRLGAKLAEAAEH